MSTNPSRLHPAVLNLARAFQAVGLPTPGALVRKAEWLLPVHPGERITIVVADVIRCSTTLLAALAAGACGATITVKSTGRGTSAEKAAEIASLLGAPLVTGGELGGQPISGGLIANSPAQAAVAGIAGSHLLFASTNFGSMFIAVIDAVHSIESVNGKADVLIGSLSNVEALATRIQEDGHSRIFIATGGFYESASFEDLVFGGQSLAKLGIPFREMDDEARMMWASARAVPTPDEQYAAFRTNHIGRALAYFGMDSDIRSIVFGENIPPDVYSSMRTIVPEVHFINGEPVIALGRKSIFNNPGAAR